MSTPHEYFDEHGNPYNDCRGNSALYEDVDAIANECDDQLPGVSTIGRGPRGDSWNPEILENTDDTFKFDLVNDRTDEHYPEDAPNLHAGKLVSNVEEVDGKLFLVLTLYRGGSEEWNRSIELPPGPKGSYSFIYKDDRPIRVSDAWIASIPANKLQLTNVMPEEQPSPRNYDVVFANVIDPDTYIDPEHYDVRFAAGVVYAVNPSETMCTVSFRTIISNNAGGSITGSYLFDVNKDEENQLVTISKRTLDGDTETTFPYSNVSETAFEELVEEVNKKVEDPDYVHTDNNFTDGDKEKVLNTIQDPDYVHTDNNFTNLFKSQLIQAVQDIVNLYTDKQDKTDDTLLTTEHTIVGAINEILSLISSVLTFRGVVDTESDLPVDAETGDVYNVIAPNPPRTEPTLFAWNGTEWQAMGGALDLSGYRTAIEQAAIDATKVDKIAGMGLSHNDYTDAERDKLNNIEEGAEANVQSDWNETRTDNDAFIKNKPTIPTKTSDLINDSDFVSDEDYVHTDNNFSNTYKSKMDQGEIDITNIKSAYIKSITDDPTNKQFTYIAQDNTPRIIDYSSETLTLLGGNHITTETLADGSIRINFDGFCTENDIDDMIDRIFA